MIEVRINGETKSIPEGQKVGKLLETLGVRDQTLLVERNGELIRREAFDDEIIAHMDVLELIRITGGG
ncbi:MAG: sulfur carrier protein ThiS [Myxococcota bacterium]|nr:sulfur carrier protein ThiS [Myxococcota bacterium]